MISFSVPGGGVGPLSISTTCLSFRVPDVVAGEWRKAANETALPTPGSVTGRSVEAIIDEELEPGDILYIPPGSRMKATRWKMR